MLRHSNWSFIPITLALVVNAAGAGSAEAPAIEIGGAPKSEPVTLSGQSGGNKTTADCGRINAAPNHLIKITQRTDYLRLTASAPGQPTLLVEGQKERFCVLADSASGEKPEMSGVWLPGTYRVYIGDRAGGQHRYTLTISTQKP